MSRPLESVFFEVELMTFVDAMAELLLDKC